MTFKRKLADRAVAARVVLTLAEISQLETYFNLLSRWSARMNLTALPLQGLPDATIDRLFIEPLAAARYVSKSPILWLDIGSGGGSPAIPLKVVRRQARLTMVESKGRKAAFLREAIRTLDLRGAEVQNTRFEALCEPAAPNISADLVTVRAVKADPALIDMCRVALHTGGELLLFQSHAATGDTLNGFKRVRTVQLSGAPSFLDVMKAV
ncbi:MAG: class I SAM-dependent methyltransferase [Acidobacteria bacterium]|nr:class I SAM-dependent methyltransferase [Acidobacteriota bacterium]